MTAPSPQCQADDAATRHTATPWRIEGHSSRPREDRLKGHRIISDRGDGFEFHIAAVGTHPGINAEVAKANAALIVEAVNNHASLKARIEVLEAALRPFWAVAKVMDFYTEESMPVMIFPRPECESQYPDEPRCVALTTADFHALAALGAKP